MNLPFWRPWPEQEPVGAPQGMGELLARMDEWLWQMTAPLLTQAAAVPAGELLQPGPVQWQEEGTDLVLRMPLPHADPTRLEVRLGETSLSLRAEARHEVRAERQEGVVTSAQWGQMAATLPLPVPVDAARGQAAYRGGVLEVRAPKLRALTVQSD